uniref:CUB domain-containing protein n=1 Tax=Panagrellus redivivus TaxID=6233 RepID=A0A7E4ZUX6_PANRE
MTKCTFIVVFSAVIQYLYGVDIAKNVEGGVQLINTGPIELIVPDDLSFTVKRITKAQSCGGAFIICYEATTTIMREEERAYYNFGEVCPLGTCALAVEAETAWYLSLDKRYDGFYARFYDENPRACPRKVINNRTNFTIIELPECPVIVNEAKIPQDDKPKKNNSQATVGIIAVCMVIIILLLVIIIIAGYCIYKRSKRQSTPSAKSLNQCKFPPRNTTTAQLSRSEPEQPHRRLTSWRSHDGSAYGSKKHFSDNYNTHDDRYSRSTNMVTSESSRRNPMI